MNRQKTLIVFLLILMIVAAVALRNGRARNDRQQMANTSSSSARSSTQTVRRSNEAQANGEAWTNQFMLRKKKVTPTQPEERPVFPIINGKQSLYSEKDYFDTRQTNVFDYGDGEIVTIRTKKLINENAMREIIARRAETKRQTALNLIELKSRASSLKPGMGSEEILQIMKDEPVKTVEHQASNTLIFTPHPEHRASDLRSPFNVIYVHVDKVGAFLSWFEVDESRNGWR